MNRRKFIGLTAALSLTPLMASAAEGWIEYEWGNLEGMLAAGDTVFVDYSATWCGTCKRQERVIAQLRAQNPAYDQAMKFVRVDWDTYLGEEVTTSRNIPRRSTLLVLRGNQELGRIVAGTSVSDIQTLMNLAL